MNQRDKFSYKSPTLTHTAIKNEPMNDSVRTGDIVMRFSEGSETPRDVPAKMNHGVNDTSNTREESSKDQDQDN